MNLKNEEFFKVGDSKIVTVSLRFDVDNRAGDEVALRNAQDILAHYNKGGELKSFVRSIKIDEA